MRLFTDILRDIRNGKAVEEATMQLGEAVRACDLTDKPASVTVTIKINPAKDGGAEKSVECDVTCKIPRKSIPPAIFFSNEEGDLGREDPNQRAMFEDAGTTSERALAARSS